MMLVNRLINAIGDELNDIEPGYEHTRWPLPQIREYITEALEQIAALKPELFATTENLRLKPGISQVIPSAFSKLVDVPFNVDASGSIGDAILPASYTLSRYFNKPSCVPTSSTGGISSFRVDPNNPRVFYVNPAAKAHPPQYVQVLGQARPQTITADTTTIDFSGGDAATYFNAIKDWALYRAFMKDTESQTSMQRAKQHYQAFYQFLNVKVQMDSYNKGRAKQGVQQVNQDDTDV